MLKLITLHVSAEVKGKGREKGKEREEARGRGERMRDGTQREKGDRRGREVDRDAKEVKVEGGDRY